MWILNGKEFNSRFLLGTSLYPSLEVLTKAIQSSHAEIVTISLRRQNPEGKGGEQFWEALKSLNLTFLPNTAGCRSAKEAITTALMAREVFSTNWIKLEVIGDEYNLSPDPFELVKAAQALVKEDFEVFPYTTEDLVLAEALLNAGCRVLMPWGAPIGSGLGLNNPHGLKTLRKRFPDIPMIVDAGIGLPSHAVAAMEMGFDGILLNTAVALSQNPIDMSKAFGLAIQSGRLAFEAGPMLPRELASPSTPIIGTPFWHTEKRGPSLDHLKI